MTNPTATDERRQHTQVREVFVRACELLAPIVAGNDTIKTVSNFAMAHMVEQHFPELSPAEIHIVIATVEKLHREERLQAILKKQH
ncbi:MAG: hypothetical protein WC742_06795 [Gallionellaceae bacterium]|jgi:hypothetical protein